MKTCFKCGRSLPIDDFYTHPMMADGHLGKCKECTRADAKRRYYDKHDEVMEYERKRIDDPERRVKQREYGRVRYRSDPVRAQKQKQESADRYPEKKAARMALKLAVKSGIVARMPCEVCGELNSQGHHDDYSKPLDVIWLCSKHHGERHRKIQHKC